jgi:hypothetical protein
MTFVADFEDEILKPYRDFYIACTVALCLLIAALALIARRREAAGCRTLICAQDDVASHETSDLARKNLPSHTVS